MNQGNSNHTKMCEGIRCGRCCWNSHWESMWTLLSLLLKMLNWLKFNLSFAAFFFLKKSPQHIIFGDFCHFAFPCCLLYYRVKPICSLPSKCYKEIIVEKVGKAFSPSLLTWIHWSVWGSGRITQPSDSCFFLCQKDTMASPSSTQESSEYPLAKGSECPLEG